MLNLEQENLKKMVTITSDNKVKTRFIFEMLGRPPEHIVETMNLFIDKLNEQKGVEVIERIVHEPKPLEDENAKDLFTNYAEVEVVCDNLHLVYEIVLNMLPANIEILEPENIKLSNFDLTSMLSQLAIRLHRFDEVTKAVALEREQLVNKVKELESKIGSLESGNGSESKDSEDSKNDKDMSNADSKEFKKLEDSKKD